ncbi:MAG: FIST C-terminal domain-containing protein [Deltaproteobacteria bacterium]|nr:FIST C-terminal domain-containing protein [Deltaproteobacteria bacterium]MBI3391400.1 FIST C-terminal domain-containing protein [Deltaproteobacteria bacterium]
MKWASTVSDAPQLATAIADAGAALRLQLGGATPDLILAFISAHHHGEYERVPELIAAQFGNGLLLGCSAGGVIGGGKEIEQRPGVSLTAATLPGVDVAPFHVDAGAMPTPNDPPAAWERSLAVPNAIDPNATPHFLLLPDPFSIDSEVLLRGLDRAYPASTKLGGLASGAQQPGANALFLGRALHRAGVVGVALSGDIAVDTIVAQGCRPIGQPMFITRCQQNLLWELDGQPAMQVLQDLYEQLEPEDQALIQHSLFLGIVMSEHQQQYRQGDFLIRNLIGTDPTRTALAVGALLRENSVVQFHLRDAKTSSEDLRQLLSRYRTQLSTARPRGALLFSCLGRGAHLYGRPDHDTDAFRQHIGDVPLGGFFCNGEIGPVHGSSFLHGYTSSFGVFRRRLSD